MKLVLRGKLRHVKKFFSSLSIGISIKPKGVRSWEQDSTEKPGKQRNDLIDDSITGAFLGKPSSLAIFDWWSLPAVCDWLSLAFIF